MSESMDFRISVANALRQFEYEPGGALSVNADGAATALENLFTHVGYWRYDVSDQCQHCESDRLYQTWSHEEGFYYDQEDGCDLPLFRLNASPEAIAEGSGAAGYAPRIEGSPAVPNV